MSSKIDFEPNVFDEAYKSSKSINPEPRKLDHGLKRSLRKLGFIAGAIVVSIVFLIVVAATRPSKEAGIGYANTANEPDLPMLVNSALVERGTSSPHISYRETTTCSGFEIACMSLQTNKPSESVTKIFSGIQTNPDKQYRITISIVPLDD